VFGGESPTESPIIITGEKIMPKKKSRKRKKVILRMTAPGGFAKIVQYPNGKLKWG